MRRPLTALLFSLVLAGCHSRGGQSALVGPLATATSSTPPPMAITLAPQINQSDFLRYERALTSRAFGGRKPVTRGEVLTTHYLVVQLKRMRIAPGYHGRWLQPVPVVSTRVLNTATRLRVRLPAGVQTFPYGSALLAATQQARAHVDIAGAPIVFVGYGIDAPGWQWNDYQHLDVRGKIVIALANDPGGMPSRYGLAREKFAQAARRGAAACFILRAGTSARPWGALRNLWTGTRQSLPANVAPGARLAVAGWLRHAAAERLFGAAGLNLAALTRAAAQPDFKAVALPATASIRLDSAIEYGWSDNVLGLIRGAVHPNQLIIYSAHWDGLGALRGPRGRLERLPGAVENAAGVAALLEIADSFAHRRARPARSVLFLLPTLGDAGQLGSRYYVRHPVFALNHTVADINIDFWPILGRARDMTVHGSAQSSLQALLAQRLALQGRTLSSEPPSAGALFEHSDQDSFARAGVPAILAGPGLELLSGGREAGEAAWEAYVLHRLDTPRDTFNPHWDLSGSLEDIQTLYLLGRDLADSTEWPNWAPGSPYRAQRDAMMARVPDGPAPASPGGSLP